VGGRLQHFEVLAAVLDGSILTSREVFVGLFPFCPKYGWEVEATGVPAA
jgi:hypothetical protein